MYSAIYHKRSTGCKEYEKRLNSLEALKKWIDKQNEKGAGIYNVSFWRVQYDLVFDSSY